MQAAFGIDYLLEDAQLLKRLKGGRVGILTNQASTDKNFVPSAYALSVSLKKSLVCIFTPEHGWNGFNPEGAKIGHSHELFLNIPIFSLYNDSPFAEILEEAKIDTLIIDLPDVGVRCYTYAATCAQLLNKLIGTPVEIIICDRPNPLGPVTKGPLLKTEYQSFLSYFDIPFQHGRTIGDILKSYYAGLEGNDPSKLKIISPQHLYYPPYGYPWVPPSPNLPTWDAALLYPGLVLLEGTNVSEGRGTTLPFACLGAPNLDAYKLAEHLNALANTGVRARPLSFTPATGKLKLKECQGVQLHIVDPQQIDGFTLGVSILTFLRENYPKFEWLTIPKPSPEAGAEERYVIDALVGNDCLRKEIEKVRAGWEKSFQLMAKNKDDNLLDADSLSYSCHEEEWQG